MTATEFVCGPQFSSIRAQLQPTIELITSNQLHTCRMDLISRRRLRDHRLKATVQVTLARLGEQVNQSSLKSAHFDSALQASHKGMSAKRSWTQLYGCSSTVPITSLAQDFFERQSHQEPRGSRQRHTWGLLAVEKGLLSYAWPACNFC